jgi:hypothetical protein
MRITMFLSISYFIQVKELNKCLQPQDGHFSPTRNISNDLMNEKQ